MRFDAREATHRVVQKDVLPDRTDEHPREDGDVDVGELSVLHESAEEAFHRRHQAERRGRSRAKRDALLVRRGPRRTSKALSLIHISEPTRPY